MTVLLDHLSGQSSKMKGALLIAFTMDTVKGDYEYIRQIKGKIRNFKFD